MDAIRMCMVAALLIPTEAQAQQYFMRSRVTLSRTATSTPSSPPSTPQADPPPGKCDPVTRGREANFTGRQIGTDYLPGPSGRDWSEAEFVSALEGYCKARSLASACTGMIYVSPGEPSQYLVRALAGPVDIRDSYSTPPGSSPVLVKFAAKCTPAY